MEQIYSQKIINANNLFDGNLLDAKMLFLHYFNVLPSIHFISQVEGEKIFDELLKKYKNQIEDVHQYKWYKRKKKRFEFDETFIVLKNNCVIELDENYCQILHNGKNDELVNDIAALANKFKEHQRRQPLEINLIVRDGNSLVLKAMEIKRTALKLDFFYEDDFKHTDETIRKRLNQKNDKGIVLLHGLPGTGKTTYLRYLIGKIKKRVLFLSPSVAGNLMNPEFIELLIDNPNSVLIIEDAENIIMDRKLSSSSSVSNLLNISDGLLADFLNVQLICTFNNSLTLVDNALLRKGRLIAKYEFGKLSITKAQNLSKYLGFDTIINKPMTIAEITNPNDVEITQERVAVLGFRREVVMN